MRRLQDPSLPRREDSLENMEVSDMEVYWDMTDQLWEAVKDLPEGTKIGNISFE